MKQPKAPASQWLAAIRNQQGVKKEEMDWLGLEDWLKGQEGSVTKEQLVDFIRANQVQVKEVVKGAKPAGFSSSTVAVQFIADQLDMTPEQVREEYAYRQEADYITLAGSMETKAADATKFHSYQLPGGENYRELLLTLPAAPNKLAGGIEELINGKWLVTAPGGTRELFDTEEEANA